MNAIEATPPECLAPALCPIGRALRVVEGRWKPMLLCRLYERPHRFGELKRLLPEVTQRVLTRQLRELEADGVVARKVRAVMPPHVEYALTPPGAGAGAHPRGAGAVE